MNPHNGVTHAWKRHRPTALALISLTLLTFLLRYPVGHERGVDSFTLHALVGAIVQNGSMGWLVNPFSYFGFAPFSYPPAVPVSVAAFTELAGLPIEAAILVYTLVLGAAGAWTSFLLGRATFHRSGPALILSFLVSVSGGVVAFTNWNLSSRGTLLVFVPLVLALTIRALSSDPIRSTKLWFAASLVSGVLVLVHFMWLLLVPLLVAATALYRIAATENSVLIHTSKSASRSRIIVLTHAVLAVIFAFVLLRSVADLFTLSSFPAIGSSIIPDNMLTRVGVKYATEMGLAIVVLPIGLWRVAVLAERNRRYALTSLAVAFLPVSLDPVYGILLAIPVVLLIVTAAFSQLLPSIPKAAVHRRFPRAASVVSILVLLILVPYAVTVPRTTAVACGQGGSLDYTAYDAGLYLRYVGPSQQFSFAWDDPLNAARLEAVSGVPGVEPILSIGDLAHPWLAQRTRIQFTRPDDLYQSLITSQQVLAAKEWIPGVGGGSDYYLGKHAFILSSTTPDSVIGSSILNAYGTEYAVQKCPGATTIFFTSVDASSYLIFANEAQRVYWIAR